MNNLIKSSALTIFLVLVGISFATADPSKDQKMDYMKPYTGTAELEKMKSLSGTWTGTGMMHGEEKPITVIYKTTAGGSVVVETQFPDTPEEMVSIYYDNDGKMVMKHFCMLKNQPEMAVTSSNDDSIELAYTGGTNMDASKDAHMNSAVFTFVDDNNMKQIWTPYQDGKAMEGATTMTFTRVQ